MRTLLGIGAVLIAGCGAANATTLQLCNTTKNAVEFAIGYSERNGPFTTKGWWTARPGKCSDPIPRGSKGIYYLHIKKVSGGSIDFGSGNKHMLACASLTTFTDSLGDHRSNGKIKCATAGLVTLKFIRFEMSRSDLPDVLTLDSKGAVSVSNGQPDPPLSAERTPAAPPQTSQPIGERPSPPASAPEPRSRTPEACKRYPSLC